MRRRNSLRYPGYDYSREGAYFITIDTHRGVPWFRIRTLHAIVERCWRAIPDHHPNVELDAWVVMPNHMHGIVFLHCIPGDQDGPLRRAGTRPRSPVQQSMASPQRRTLAIAMRSFKAAVTMEARRAGYPDFAWQRQYYDRIVRDLEALETIRRYIRNNPRKAREDERFFHAWPGR
jgi:REP element-mobilizing transposase RayT